MLFRLILLFTLLPVVEVYLILQVKDLTSWPVTLLIILGTGMLGASLARREGMRALRQIQEDMAKGVPPTGAVVDGLLILVAGAVLITPGLLTDLCGFTLLIPPARKLIRKRLASWFKSRVVVMHHGDGHVEAGLGRRPGGEEFVDVEAEGYDVEDAHVTSSGEKHSLPRDTAHE